MVTTAYVLMVIKRDRPASVGGPVLLKGDSVRRRSGQSTAGGARERIYQGG